MFRSSAKVLAAAVLLAAASSASASTTISFSGELNDIYLADSPTMVSDAGLSTLPVTYKGKITVDSTDHDPSPGSGQYAITSYSVTFSNGLSFSSAEATATTYLIIINDDPSYFSFGFQGSKDILPSFVGPEWYAFGSYLMLPKNSFADDSIPSKIVATPISTTGQFNIMTADYLQLGINDGSYSRAKIQIGALPEASTWGMMIAGMGVIGSALRRRKVLAVA
jgi:hypothetical protein